MTVDEGRLIWADLTTPDCAAAKNFYAALLHWDLLEVPSPMGLYVVGQRDGKDLAGMMQQNPMQAGMPPMWQIYLSSENLETTLDRIVRFGGSLLVPPMSIPDGRIAIAMDPTGAGFCLMEGPEQGGFELRGVPGSVCWAEVLTRDTEKAIAFYSDVFGWEATTEPSESAGSYTTFSHMGQPMVGLMPMPGAVPDGAPAFWQVYFMVDDIDDTAALAKDLGGELLVPKMQVGNEMWFATLQDPQGAGFSIMQGEM